ncbi:Chondroitin sulfate ABC exolyase, partial [Paramuricea clavata]
SLQILLALYRKAKKAEIQPAEPQTGHWVHNFAALSIHRRKHWVVTVKGFSRYIWDFEGSSNQNIYGIYQSHGALQISNSEESLNAYDVQHGWDWTRVPGTTTIRLSLHELKMLNVNRYYQPSKLVGGVVLTSKDPRLANGVFAMRFHRPLYGSGHGKTAGYGRKRTINCKPMPAAYWQAYVEKSDKLKDPMKYLETANTFTGKELLSADCMEKIKNTVCVPLYCSEDEKSIIVPNLQDKCNGVLECINKASDKYDKLSSILKPIKDSLKGGCDKVVEAIKAATSDAYIMSHASELLLFTIGIALLAMNFH